MNALGASTLLILVVTVLFAPRRWALLGTVAGILYLTQAQQLDIGGFNLYAVRFIELAAFARVMVRKEFSFSELNKLDRTMILLYVYTVSVFLVRSREDQAYQIGIAVDALLSYVAFRGLVENAAGFRWFLRAFVVLLIPYVAFVSIETLTSNNPFASIGGIELIRAGDRWFRDGRLRATGSFGHPSLMGTLGGTFLPLYIGLAFARSDRFLASVGIVLSLAIVWASNSGGPATCVFAAILGWMLWTMRGSMRWVRRASVAFIALLALAMKAPIWYLLSRISDITGGDGYHRSVLLDVAFQNLDIWWLAGMRLLDTSKWLPYTNTNTGAVDMTNNFLVFGITAGLGSMLLLIALLIQGFKHIGQALALLRSRGDKELEYLYWGLGVMLGVHLFNWFGITYWDQSNLLWFMHLAVVSSLSHEIIHASPERSPSSLPKMDHARISVRSWARPSPRVRDGRAPGYRSTASLGPRRSDFAGST
jgi:hypothetical protein